MVSGTCNIEIREHLDDDIDMAAHKARIKQMNLDYVDALDDEVFDEVNQYDSRGIVRKVNYPTSEGYVRELINYDGTFIQTVKKVGTKSDYVLIHVHGGIFVKRLSDAFGPLMEMLAEQSGALVVTADFRTPPNAPYEAGVEDIVNAYKYIQTLGYDAEHIIMYAESSGAAFALSALLRLRDLGYPPIKGATFFCPYVGFDTTTESYKEYCDSDIVLSERMIGYVKKAIGIDVDPGLVQKYFDFVHKDLSGLPYMFAIAGEQEIIKSEFLEVFKRAATYGADTDVIIVKEMYHSFQHSSALKTAGYYMDFLFHKIRSLMK